jgi:hypothetical protein
MGFLNGQIAYRWGVGLFGFCCLVGERWVRVGGWAMLVPDCIVLSLFSLLSPSYLEPIRNRMQKL